MYRRMCFNVYAHNRDDHAKNFSFLYEEEKKCWRLSPAYDLTYSTTHDNCGWEWEKSGKQRINFCRNTGRLIKRKVPEHRSGNQKLCF